MTDRTQILMQKCQLAVIFFLSITNHISISENKMCHQKKKKKKSKNKTMAPEVQYQKETTSNCSRDVYNPS